MIKPRDALAKEEAERQAEADRVARLKAQEAARVAKLKKEEMERRGVNPDGGPPNMVTLFKMKRRIRLDKQGSQEEKPSR